MSFGAEFRTFALKGNVVDLAVGVIIGGAFGKIVGSLVNDIIMPVIGLILGGLNFSDLAVTVREAVIKYGSFLQAVIDFVIIAFVLFLIIRYANKLKKPVPAAAPPPTPEDVLLLREIRDALKR